MVLLNNLTQEDYKSIYLLSLIIIVAYTAQYFNTLKVLGTKIYKSPLFNYDIIISEVKYALEDPSSVKFYFYPATWALIIISIFIHYRFPHSDNLLFYTLAILLFIPNYIHWNFVLSLAEKVEDKGISIEDSIKDKEFTTVRKTIRKGEPSEITLNLKEISPKEIGKHFNNLIDKEAKYFKDTDNFYELYEHKNTYRLDKIDLVMSPTFDQLYKEENINNLGGKLLLEALVVSIVLYLAVLIKHF